jgi:tetratricopeptide (TPR) repeat protein
MNLRKYFLCLGFAAAVACGHEDEGKTIARLSDEIAARPADGSLFTRRAALHLERGDWQACLVDLERAERAGQGRLEVLRARALMAGRHYEHAIAVVRPLADDVTAAILMARSKAELGRVVEAAEDYHQALKRLAHPEPDHFLEGADLLCRAGRSRDALVLLDRAPQTIVIVERAMQLESPDAALKRLDKLIEVSQVQEPLLAKKAVFLAQNRREAESAAVWRTLADRITHLPPQARGSHAMSKLAQQAHHALAALQSSFSAP